MTAPTPNSLKPHGEDLIGDGQLTVCVAKVAEPDDLEDIIRDQMARLPCRTVRLCGTHLEQDAAGRGIGGPRALRRLAYALGRLPGFPGGRTFDARATRRFLAREGVHALLAQYGVTGVVAHRPCLQAGIPLIVHCRGVDVYRESILERWGAAYGRVFPQCAAVIAVSQAMVERVVELGADAGRVRCIPSGADCDLFRPTDPSRNPPHFAGAARFVDKKAPHLTILAFERVRQARPEARLTLAGDGPLRPACRDLVAAMGLGGCVDLPGRLPHEEVPHLLAGARAFVQHSLVAGDGNAEGTPIAAMEAGAAGLPVVATRHMGIPELVVEGETGFLVDERDVAGMADRMLSLAQDPELAAGMGRAGRERVERHFSLAGAVRAIWETIKEAVESA